MEIKRGGNHALKTHIPQENSLPMSVCSTMHPSPMLPLNLSFSTTAASVPQTQSIYLQLPCFSLQSWAPEV